jgi:hypothetical protein
LQPGTITMEIMAAMHKILGNSLEFIAHLVIGMDYPKPIFGQSQF